ncbi:hypothetical protein ACHAQJ_002435 [Trichoderma viride]
MNHLLSASVDEVSRLSAKRLYDFIIVGTGMGGGVLARTLIEQSKASKGRPPRVLLIERGGLVLSTHCANTPSPRWNTTGLEGPSMNTDIVFRSLKSSVSTGAKSIEYEGGPVYCIGGRSTVWGLYTPRIPRRLLSGFPEDVQNYLDQNYDRAYRLLCNGSATLDSPYPAFIKEVSSNIQDFTSKLSAALSSGLGITSEPFTCCPMGAEFIPRVTEESLYRIPMGGFSTVNWILDQVYNGSENVNVLAQTQVLTVNERSDKVRKYKMEDYELHTAGQPSRAVDSLTVRDHLGIEHTIPTGGATVILSAGTLCTARIALRSGIGGTLAGSGLTDHDIWGTRFEYMPSNNGVTAWLRNQALKVQSWVQLSDNKKHSADCLLNITINAQSFLGESEERSFPVHHFGLDGELMPMNSFHERLDGMDDKKSTKVQVVFEFKSELRDENRVLNLPQPHETVLIESRDDNTIYLSCMRTIARAIKNVLIGHNSLSEDESWPEITRAGFGVVAHEVGTMRMGDDPGKSVVDKDLKVHGWSNLHVCDLSVFPESPAANPSLTLTVLAQRLGTKLYKSMS